MRKIATVILILVLCQFSFSGSGSLSLLGVGTNGKISGGGSCSTSTDTNLITKSGTTVADLDSVYRASKIIVASTITVTEYQFTLCGVSSPTEDVMLYTHNSGGNTPGSLVSGSSATNGSIAACGTGTGYTFTLSTPKTGITSGTYWVVSKSSSGDNRSPVFTSSGDRVCQSTDGSTWGTCYDDASFNFIVRGCN